MRAWLAIAMQESIRKRAIRIAVVVGSILALINHGDALLSGQMTVAAWIKVVLTFVVPYCVSTFASVQAIRQHSERGSADLLKK